MCPNSIKPAWAFGLEQVAIKQLLQHNLLSCDFQYVKSQVWKTPAMQHISLKAEAAPITTTSTLDEVRPKFVHPNLPNTIPTTFPFQHRTQLRLMNTYCGEGSIQQPACPKQHPLNEVHTRPSVPWRTQLPGGALQNEKSKSRRNCKPCLTRKFQLKQGRKLAASLSAL